jgi:hypothetical protein
MARLARTVPGVSLLSPDHRTVGWLVEYPVPFQGANLAGKLVLYRAGHVLHTFNAGQIFWDWGFRDGGKRVAYSTGLTHGGAAECVLRDVESGRIVARWQVTSTGKPPSWAEALHQ